VSKGKVLLVVNVASKSGFTGQYTGFLASKEINPLFGGWLRFQNEMVHGSDFERFAKCPAGRIEKPKASG